jgi:hypothetical protein
MYLPHRFFDADYGSLRSNHITEWSHWDHQVAYGVSNAAPYRGIRTATQTTDKRYGMSLFLDTTAGANLVWEAQRKWGVYPTNVGSPGYANSFGNPFYFSMRMNRSNLVGSNAGEKYQGLFWGDTWEINTPWQTNFASATNTNGRIGLHFNYTSGLWQVQLYLNDTFAPDLITCGYQAPFVIDQQFAELAIAWVPADSSGNNSRFMAFLNGTIALDLKNNARANQIFATDGGPGIYWTNGSNASSACSEGGFYYGRIWHPAQLLP